MTDMFIPKKEKIIIMTEAMIYVLLIIVASYFTICGNMFIRMVPMIYFLGIFGVIAFNKPIVTVVLSCISTIVFGILVEHQINSSILLFAVYSTFMIICGEITGHILNIFYENFRLRKFIKYYHKFIYAFILLLTILVPVILNNVVNSNFITYIIAKDNVERYINEHYVFTNYYINDIKYCPSYKGGIYEFNTVVDGVDVQINYTTDEKVSDVNMNKRKEMLNKIANAEINIMLKEKNLTSLDVNCIYDYSKIATIPDVIKMNIYNVELSQVNDVVFFIDYLKNWSKYEMVERIDISIDNKNVSITKNNLKKDDINAEYILNGMKQESLSSREGI